MVDTWPDDLPAFAWIADLPERLEDLANENDPLSF